MKLSTKGRYGVRAMLDLAQNYGQGPITLKSIAERQEISEHYLEQLMASLRKANIVKSIRGAYGGYMLAKEPENIYVGDIVRVLEGPIAPVECVNDEEGQEFCDKIDGCVARLIWMQLRDNISEVLDSISLADLCEKARSIENQKQEEGYIFHI